MGTTARLAGFVVLLLLVGLLGYAVGTAVGGG